jgi:hypothetical protein
MRFGYEWLKPILSKRVFIIILAGETPAKVIKAIKFSE